MAVKKLGTRIRKFREAKEMTRETLAATAGLSVEFITALEEEGLYPSLGPLQQVARALSIRLGTFMDDVVVKDPIIVTARNREPDLIMQQSRTDKETSRYYSLAKGKADRNMDPFFITLQPDTNPDKLSSHEGEEFIIVVSGKLRIICGEAKRILEPGDTVYYNSIVPHYVGAAGDEPCSIYAVIYQP